MADRVPAETFPPGEFLKEELDERGWTQEEFAAIIGRPTTLVNQIVLGKRPCRVIIDSAPAHPLKPGERPTAPREPTPV